MMHGNSIIYLKKSMFIPGPAQPRTNRYRSSFQWGTRSGRGVYLSPQSTDKKRNEWSYIFRPPLCLNGVVRDEFTFIHIRTRGLFSRRLLPTILSHNTSVCALLTGNIM